MPPLSSCKISFDHHSSPENFRGFPIPVLAKALENLSPEKQKNMIGELLYSLAERIEPFFGAKITGMLLELEQTELFNLLESPKALKERVKEAVDVLGDWIPQQLELLEQVAYEDQASMLLAKL